MLSLPPLIHSVNLYLLASRVVGNVPGLAGASVNKTNTDLYLYIQIKWKIQRGSFFFF